LGLTTAHPGAPSVSSASAADAAAASLELVVSKTFVTLFFVVRVLVYGSGLAAGKGGGAIECHCCMQTPTGTFFSTVACESEGKYECLSKHPLLLHRPNQHQHQHLLIERASKVTHVQSRTRAAQT